MFVLKIIVFLIALFLVYRFIVEVNEYTMKKYSYEFFNWGNYFASAAGYGFIYFGNNWYTDALKNGGDLLNGELLVLIGFILIVSVVTYNVKMTSILIGLTLSIIQLILYIGFAIAGFFILIMAIAFFAQIRPVYSINER